MEQPRLVFPPHWLAQFIQMAIWHCFYLHCCLRGWTTWTPQFWLHYRCQGATGPCWGCENEVYWKVKPVCVGVSLKPEFFPNAFKNWIHQSQVSLSASERWAWRWLCQDQKIKMATVWWDALSWEMHCRVCSHAASGSDWSYSINSSSNINIVTRPASVISHSVTWILQVSRVPIFRLKQSLMFCKVIFWIKSPLICWLEAWMIIVTVTIGLGSPFLVVKHLCDVPLITSWKTSLHHRLIIPRGRQYINTVIWFCCYYESWLPALPVCGY